MSGSQGDTKLDPACDVVHSTECAFCEESVDPRLLETFGLPSCVD